MNMQIKFSLPAMSNKSKDQFSPPFWSIPYPVVTEFKMTIKHSHWTADKPDTNYWHIMKMKWTTLISNLTVFSEKKRGTLNNITSISEDGMVLLKANNKEIIDHNLKWLYRLNTGTSYSVMVFVFWYGIKSWGEILYR